MCFFWFKEMSFVVFGGQKQQPAHHIRRECAPAPETCPQAAEMRCRPGSRLPYPNHFESRGGEVISLKTVGGISRPGLPAVLCCISLEEFLTEKI